MRFRKQRIVPYVTCERISMRMTCGIGDMCMVEEIPVVI